MSHTFDTHALPRIVDDVDRLIARASEHERQLAELLRRLEADGPETHPMSDGAHGSASARFDLVSTARDLCVAAEEQRLVASTIRRRVLGDLAPGHPESPALPRVLVVDDSPESCEMAAMVLELAGFFVITASNGLQAVLAAHLASPLAVLMDINMPVLNGIEAARLLKASAVTRDVQVIAYSAKPDFHHGPMTGLFIEVVPKPSSPDSIVATVRRCASAGGNGVA